jgi:hypothetical protein
MQEFGITKGYLPNNSLGLWGGNRFIISGKFSSLQILRRYSLDYISLRGIVFDAISRFNKLYSAQECGYFFETPSELLHYCGLSDYVEERFDSLMKRSLRGNGLMLPELMFAVNKVNYNQGNNINALAGLGVLHVYRFKSQFC